MPMLRLLGNGKEAKVELGQHIIKLDENGEFKSHLLPISTAAPAEGPSTPPAHGQSSPTPSETSSSIQTADGEGHLISMRKESSQMPFEDVPLREGRGMLSGKLLQVLEKRKAQEAEIRNKMELEHASALQRRDRIHMEQLDLMEAAHSRTVQHLEEELERVRSQFAQAMNKWEQADEECTDLREQLAIEKKFRAQAERECEELSSLLEDNLD